MKNKFFCQLILIFATVGANAAICEPGSISNKKSHLLVLQDFSLNSGRILMNSEAGRLSISAINDEIVEIYDDGYKTKITLSVSYGQIANELGVLRSKVVYSLKTNSNCDDFEILSKLSDSAIEIGTPDSRLSQAAQMALKSYVAGRDVIPGNTHSGDYLLRIHTPEICSNGQNATVNIVRSNHQSSGIMYKTTSVLVDLESGSILKTDVRPGRFLRHMCQ